MPGVALSSERSLEAHLCRADFFTFVETFWSTVVPESPVWNWHIPYLCKELQKLAENVFLGKPKLYDLIINIPPGSTKSTICSVMFPAWIWTRMISARCICGSHTAPLSLDLSRRSRIIVNSDKYAELFPEVQLSQDQATKSHYANTKGGARMATMVGSVITGFHAHFIIIDDPIDPKGSTSKADLKVANDWMRETLSTRKVDKANTPTILIMQRLHQDDPTGNWLVRSKKDEAVKDSVKHICLPAEESEKVSPPRLHKYYKDGLLDPLRLSKSILHASRMDLGEFGYACQFDQNPIPREGGVFKMHRLLMEKTAPTRFLRTVRYWDKGGTAGGGCYTAGVKLGMDRHQRVWILNVIRGQWDAHEREQVILQTAIADGKDTVVYVEQEPGSGGKESAQNTIHNLSGFRIFADRPTGSKEYRSEPFQSQVNAGNIYMVIADWNLDYIDEFKYYPASKYKDQVDGTSGAYNHLSKPRRRVGAL